MSRPDQPGQSIDMQPQPLDQGRVRQGRVSHHATAEPNRQHRSLRPMANQERIAKIGFHCPFVSAWPFTHLFHILAGVQ